MHLFYLCICAIAIAMANNEVVYVQDLYVAGA